MSYRLPTVSQFKSQFSRDFPYAVPAWGAEIALTLTAGVVTAVALVKGGQGYKTAPTLSIQGSSGSGCVLACTVAFGAVATVSVTSGGSGYSPDSRVIATGGAGDDTDTTRVMDGDIEGALFDASYNVSQALFDTEPSFQRAFNYLAAHNLVEKLLASGEGLASQYNWLTASKSIGSLQESFQIPERVSKDPMLSSYSKTRYGAMYLQIISPLLIGACFASYRKTLP